MDDQQIFTLFQSSRLFSALDDEICKKILSHFKLLKLESNELLFSQGDPSDYMYVLLSGELTAILTTASGIQKKVGTIDPGESVGELGVFTNESRTLTIRANTESFLLKLPAKKFIELCHKYPSIMFATIHPIVARSRNLIHLLSQEKNHRHIIILPANDKVSLEEFYKQLIKFARHLDSVRVISDYDPAFEKEEVKISKKIRRYIYVLRSNGSVIASKSLKNMDVLYVAATSNVPAEFSPSTNEIIKRYHKRTGNYANFILAYPKETDIPLAITPWLSLSKFHVYHQIRFDVKKDVTRLLRFMRGRAVGLVLGGGGSRGWGHLGVIKALRESKIPIDIIGGTSVGAVVGACYGLRQSYDVAYDSFSKIISQSQGTTRWYDITWPVVSLFSGKNYTQALESEFKDTIIESMWIPYFCISTNLADITETIHVQGVLWRALRASTALPGLIPPMVLDGNIHMDGGLLNNLPVDVMRSLIGTKGRIIAVELNSFAPINKKYNFPPIIRFRDYLKSLFKRRKTYPGFLDTLLRSLFAGSILDAKQNSLAANVFISLNLGKYRLLDASPSLADELVSIGYDEAMKIIQKDTKVEQEPKGLT